MEGRADRPLESARLKDASFFYAFVIIGATDCGIVRQRSMMRKILSYECKANLSKDKDAKLRACGAPALWQPSRHE